VTEIPESCSNSVSVTSSNFLELLSISTDLVFAHYAEGVSAPYVGALLPLAFLAPELVAKAFAGTQPIELTTAALLTRIDLPLAWSEQKAAFGCE
jgi:hypothetical protein